MPKTPPITEAEWSLMNVLWEESPRTASDLHGCLGKAQDWSLATVKTLLSRLVGKGALTTVKDGKRFLYRPAVTRAAAVKEEGRSLLKRAGKDASSPLIAYFMKQGKLGPDEIQSLRELLDDLESGQPKGGAR